jgi:NADPH-dependent glutamate synthase beta subunit-like oxidoreductase
MLASADEIEEGQEEGIKILNSQTFEKIITANGAGGVVCSNVESFRFDENKRLVLNIVPDSQHTLEADTVIFAVGQSVDIPEGYGLQTGRGNTIVVDNYQTSKAGVFAAGDDVIGTSSVVQAIAAGRGAASAIDKYLGGNGDIEETLVNVDEPDQYIGREEKFAYRERKIPACKPSEERSSSFEEHIHPFEEGIARCEAERCLQCDLRLKMDKVKFWGDYSHK